MGAGGGIERTTGEVTAACPTLLLPPAPVAFFCARSDRICSLVSVVPLCAAFAALNSV